MTSSFMKSILEIRTSSAATNMHDLKLDIQDAVIDLWHHPQVAKSFLNQQPDAPKIHLQVLVNLLTLHCAPPLQAQTDIQTICEWLQSNKVTYEIGYAPPPTTSSSPASRISHVHRLVLNASSANIPTT